MQMRFADEKKNEKYEIHENIGRMWNGARLNSEFF